MTPHDAYTKRLESLFAAAMDMYTNTTTIIIVINYKYHLSGQHRTDNNCHYHERRKLYSEPTETVNMH